MTHIDHPYSCVSLAKFRGARTCRAVHRSCGAPLLAAQSAADVDQPGLHVLVLCTEFSLASFLAVVGRRGTVWMRALLPEQDVIVLSMPLAILPLSRTGNSVRGCLRAIWRSTAPVGSDVDHFVV